MPKRVGPEAKIISLFTALPDDSKRIVMDVIKSQTATPRKTAANKKTVKAGAKCVLPNCGLAEDAPVHQTDNDDYHVFHAAIRTRGGKVNGEDKVQGTTA